MKIKKIELLGFKSFCDRTTLNFQDEITAVVGPNGCGKSNIVDAIRWVMGTKSAKQLRGQSMEDVIFAGTESRGPMGMAEVTFTLDLSDGDAPAQYAGYSEVGVTRRLFRDGTSEYTIQKVPCRLQDIKDLFLGTGVGHQAYSIIEQGRIAAVVSARPETRRNFIEEAAGITRYKERKHKAELKMEATRQNLLRVGDIVSELETSMRRLWRAAKRAERFEDCRDEVADLEKWKLSQDLLENMGRTQLTRLDQDQLNRTIADLERSVTERDATLAAERLELRGLEVTLSERNARAVELDNRVKLLEAQSTHDRREAEEITRRQEAEAVESRHLEGVLSENETDLQIATRALEEVEKEYDTQREQLGAREAELTAARAEQAALDEELETLRQGVSQAETRSATLDAEKRSLEQRLLETAERIAELDREAQQLSARRESLQPAIGVLEEQLTAGEQEKVTRISRHDALEDRLDELKSVASRLEIQLDTVRGQLHRNRSRLSSLEEIQRRYEGFQQGTRAIMAKVEDGEQAEGIHGLLADVVDAPAEYETAVEAVLGERLSAVLVSDPEVTVDAVEYLKEGNRGRSCFVPVEGMREPPGSDTIDRAAAGPGDGPGFESLALAAQRSAREAGYQGDTEITDPGIRGMILDLINVDQEYREVAGQLLADVVVVESLEQALEVWKQQKTPRTVVTLDGEVVDPVGLVTGGSTEGQGAGVLAQKREIRELSEICTDLERHHNELEERLVSTKEEMAATVGELDELVRSMHQADMELLGRSKDLETTREQLQEVHARLETVLADRRRFEELVTELKQQADAGQTELGELTEHRSRAGARLAELLESSARHLRHVEDLVSRVSDLKVTVARAAEKQHTRRQERARLEADIRSARMRLDNLRTAAGEHITRLQELESQVDQADRERLELSSEVMNLTEELSQERAEVDHRRLTLDETDSEIKGLRDELREVSHRRESINIQVLELDKDRERLEERLQERHGLRGAEVLHEYHLRPIFSDELIQRLTKQSKVLESLRATYYPSARKEYDELKERYEFLTMQRQDLEDALERLQKAIQKINRTSRARFREAFEAINREFQAVFPRLFNGGRARLDLTQAPDILNAGVEIIAQPPGKKLQTVDLLSGGEKALTAVAMLFAIFRYKPSPFCLLDEVDAPLDDMNVDRFNDMVREMSDETQFVLITHAKRTMALADSLYGITMEQPGCSKVVAVNLGEASRLVDDSGAPPPKPPTAPDPADDTSGEPGVTPPAAPATPDAVA